MTGCKLKGDELANETHTAGVVSVDADIIVKQCEFENFKSGAIMLQAKERNEVELNENRILSCDTNGIYVQGRNSSPVIMNNYFGYCKSAAMQTNLDVNGIVSNVLLTSNTSDRYSETQSRRMKSESRSATTSQRSSTTRFKVNTRMVSRSHLMERWAASQ